MITNLKPYPAYKDSGVEWLGQVPAHWKVRRMKAAVHHINEQTSTRNDEDLYIALEHVESWTGRLLVPSGDPQFDSQVRRFRVGDVLFGKLRPYLAKVARPKQRGVCVGEFFVLRARPVVIPAYLEVVLRSAPAIDFINSSTYGAKMPRADWAFVGAMLFPLPPLPEQTAIARFLDYMERRIRRVIRARQRRIKLLEEYKQALIHQAVTGKIDVRTGHPYPAYKDSGVEWLDQVPEHWALKPLKRWVRINASVLPETTPADYAFRYIDIGTVGTGFLTREPQQLRFSDAPSRARRVLHIGDTIISTVRTYLRAVYYVGGDAQALVCSTGFAVLTPGPSTHAKYVSYLVQSNMFTDRVTAESVGTAYPAIAEGRLGSFYVPIPPLHEQTAIVEYLDAQTARIDAAISATRREIELLREYRTRLIADVVTGKVDVREIAAQLPEEPPEEDVALIDSDEINDSETAEDDSAAEALSVEEVEP